MNPLQLAAISALTATFASVRNLIVTFVTVANTAVPTVSGYAVNASSVCVQVLGPEGTALADFPLIEVRRTGKFALPSIRSYREANVPNTLLPYPQGMTAFDAALFADSHARKQNGAWLRRSPQAATAAITSAVSAPVPTVPDVFSMVPANVSAETGKDTAKLTSEIQGKGKK